MVTDNQIKLIIVKSIHTLVWLVFVVFIAFILWSGLTANISFYSWLAIAAVIGEGLVLLLFKGNCPLTKVARRYSNSQKENFDIYLPEWLAKYNKLIFGILFFIGFTLILLRYF